MEFTDHKVPFRSEDFIAAIAMKCWHIGTVPGSKQVDLKVILTELEAHGVESLVQIRGMKRKGRLRIEIIDDDAGKYPAYVTFSPRLTLHVKRTVWTRFQQGYSEERVIIAHEIGHILLHSDDAKPFLRDPSLQIQFAENEDSAEGQANLLADHLLIPNHIGRSIPDPARLAFACNVPDRFAFERLDSIGRIKERLSVVDNCEPCPACGDFAVTTEGGRKKCKSCERQRTPHDRFGQ
ncbi:ImmA/IrrE family metallo-endopeptidase [Bradyrhizobium stylosanthis]|uniref:ImmA/IrrE family metallo-endopeptidase n=1 Tax=Bradyrhizobium stylosanthis TaxID=1803665 RepID=UPI0007C4437F|nr:ImmA/IrrE family metallo-endopeptidase [Bradyrhizobium stylosanthis]